MADAAAKETNEGFAALISFLAKDNRKDTQERRTSQRMIQKGDRSVTMWARRTAVAVENIERMFKAFLTDAEVRQNKMMEALLEGSRAKGAGRGPAGDMAADDPKYDWKSMGKGWLKKLAPAILAGLLVMLKNLWSDGDWAKEAGMEKLSARLGTIIGGSRKGGWLNAILQSGAMGVAGMTAGAIAGAAFGLPGIIAGAILGGIAGAIGGAIAGWFGAEKIGEAIDKPLKKIKRLFGLQVEADEQIVKEKEKEFNAFKKEAADRVKALKKKRASLKNLMLDPKTNEDAIDQVKGEIFAMELQAKKDLITFADKFADMTESQRDLLANKRILAEEEIKAKQAEITATSVALAEQESIYKMLKDKGRGDTDVAKKLLEEIGVTKAIKEKQDKEKTALEKKHQEAIDELTVFDAKTAKRREEELISWWDMPWDVAFKEVLRKFFNSGVTTLQHMHEEMRVLQSNAAENARLAAEGAKRMASLKSLIYKEIDEALEKGKLEAGTPEWKKAREDWMKEILKTRGSTMALGFDTQFDGKVKMSTSGQTRIREQFQAGVDTKAQERIGGGQKAMDKLLEDINRERTFRGLKPWGMDDLQKWGKGDFNQSPRKPLPKGTPVAQADAGDRGVELTKLKAVVAASAVGRGQGGGSPAGPSINTTHQGSDVRVTKNDLTLRSPIRGGPDQSAERNWAQWSWA